MKRYPLYRYLAERMHEYVDIGPRQISFDGARNFLGKYNLPKDLRGCLIKEMVEAGVLKRKNKRCLIISVAKPVAQLS